MADLHFTRRFDLKHPLVVAPMAGGPSSVEFVIASCEAGALGSIGAAYMTAKSLEKFVSDVRLRTPKPFAINLFIPHPVPGISPQQVASALEATAPIRKELGLPTPDFKPPFEEDFEEQFEMVLRLKPAAFSFVFGLLRPEHIREARKRNIFLIGTATHFDEALALEESGIDAITLQGFEAGGHRGLFDANESDSEIPLLDLLIMAQRKIKIPLIAAGGLMTKKQIETTLQAGAQAVQIGTAFLACREAGTSAAYREALLSQPERKTRTSRAYSVRLGRGIINRFMLDLDSMPDAVLPFPAQNHFTRDIRRASAHAGRSDGLSLWCGIGKGRLNTGSVADVMQELFTE